MAVGKQAAQKFDVERFNLRKINELEVRKQYQIEISDKFAALENLSYSQDINRTCNTFVKNVRKNWNKMKQCISYLWVSGKLMIQL